MAKGKSSTGASTGAATDGVTRVEIVTRGEVRRSYSRPNNRIDELMLWCWATARGT